MSIFEGWGSRRRALFSGHRRPLGTGSGAGGGSGSGGGRRQAALPTSRRCRQAGRGASRRKRGGAHARRRGPRASARSTISCARAATGSAAGRRCRRRHGSSLRRSQALLRRSPIRPAVAGLHQLPPDRPAQAGVVTMFGSIQPRCGPASASPCRGRSAASARSTSADPRAQHRLEQQRQENLILTGDQNIIDLAYTVRWNIQRSRALPVPARRSRRHDPRGRRKRDARRRSPR